MMRPLDAPTSVGPLRDALDKLHVAWGETRESWRDENARAFERDFLQPLAIEIGQTATAIQRLSDLFRAVRRDCEPW
ncbi:MAG: hypothetical protein ACK5F7_03720 [Planctomycetaceae bacterium]|jgi:hypothetical protein